MTLSMIYNFEIQQTELKLHKACNRLLVKAHVT